MSFIPEMNIFLIGMMGSWKTTVGRILAQKLDMDFVDIDDDIESITSMSISEIFDEFGEEKFRNMESAYLREKAEQNCQVISTGGGIVLNPENREILKNRGYSILLKATPEAIVSRIKNVSKRPLLHNPKNIEKQLHQIWLERKSLYEQSAHFIVDTDNLNPNEVTDHIIAHLKVDHEDNSR